MHLIQQAEVEASIDMALLIDRIAQAFSQADTHVPMRHHHDYANPPAERDSTLLVMPAWQPGKQLGVKLVTISPENQTHGLPAIQGLYCLFDGKTGVCRSLIDAKSLTAFRTAATSALASSYLSAEHSRCLLMVGTGALAPKLIQAHALVRPLERILVWGRNRQKAELLCEQLAKQHPHLLFAIADSIEAGISLADIISCATLSQRPLIKGKWLKPGQHLDLVGSYRPDMREADDDCVRRCRIFVDHYAGATKETGDIVIPLAEGVISESDLLAELSELCQQPKPIQRKPADITLFKSVGHALEDLVAATLVAERLASS